jgi:MFS family permease
VAGRIAGRIGAKVPMTVGLTLNAVSLLLFTQIHAITRYGHIWPLLALAGIGMGLVMAPMTAAVMSSVPPQRAGMASATSNAAREIGGVFGIALLGAIVTHIFSGDLAKTINGLGLSPAIKAAILQQASRGAEQTAGGPLPPGVNAGALHTAINNSFVSGIHVAMLVAGCVLVCGAVTALVFVRSGQPLAHSVRVSPPLVAAEVIASDEGA